MPNTVEYYAIDETMERDKANKTEYSEENA